MIEQYKVKDSNGNWLSLTPKGQPSWVNNMVQATLLSNAQVQDWMRSGFEAIPIHPEDATVSWEEESHNSFPLRLGMKGDLVRNFQHWLRVKKGLWNEIQENSVFDQTTQRYAVLFTGSGIISRDKYEAYMRQL